jgi:outer membrane protein TolC
MIRAWLFLVCSLLNGLAGAVEAPILKVGLSAAELAAEKTSPMLRAVQSDQDAAQRKAESRGGELWPRLTLDGSYKYLSDVPTLSLQPGRSLSFGDHNNYSVGPTVNWTVWDRGALLESWRAARSAAHAKSEEYRASRRQVRLSVRMIYFQAQLSLEQVRLLGDSLKLAESQYQDIEKRRRAGTSSRTDALSAHQEVLERKRLFRQARADLAVSLRELFSLTGEEPACDLSLPLAVEDGQSPPEGVEPASALISLDAAADSQRGLAAAESAPEDASHPAAQAYASQSESFRRSARSVRAGLWPKVQFSARSSLDYPNGPIAESFNQNAVGFTASIPIFEGGRTRKDAAGLESQAQAGNWRKDAVLRDLRKDWLKAHDQLLGLKAQKDINEQALGEAQELARLIYDSYKGGRSTFLEVQAANLKELEARTRSAKTDAQILMQLAALASLSEKE